MSFSNHVTTTAPMVVVETSTYKLIEIPPGEMVDLEDPSSDRLMHLRWGDREFTVYKEQVEGCTIAADGSRRCPK